MQKWPLRSYLELRALPMSVRCARLHAKSILHEWHLGGLADTAELLVSEIITNAVSASADIGHQQPETGQARRAPWMRFWLASDRHGVLIQVWDGDQRQPIRQNAGLDAETGRGLLLVETLSTRWGCYAPDEQGGKIVWAVCALLRRAGITRPPVHSSGSTGSRVAPASGEAPDVPYVSTAEDLALHGVRVLGFSPSARVAGRYGLDPGTVEELLLDHEARGWVRYLSFAGLSGWSLTDAGDSENERRLAAELDRAGGRDIVVAAHQRFLPLNRWFGAACADWQIGPGPDDPMAFNDHTDWRWDDRVLQTLASLERSFRRLCGQLSECLARFDGYADLYSAALSMAAAGQHSWVDASDRDSCHMVWIQFHEDLLATLGLLWGPDT